MNSPTARVAEQVGREVRAHRLFSHSNSPGFNSDLCSLLHVASENSLGTYAFDTANTAAVCLTSRQKHQFFFVTANELGSCPEVSLRISSSVTFTNVGTHVILNQYDT